MLLPPGLDTVLILAMLGLFGLWLGYRTVVAAQAASRGAYWSYMTALMVLIVIMIAVAFFGFQPRPT